MSAQVIVEMTADESKLWRAQQRILAQQLEVERKYRGIGDAAGKAGDEAAASMDKAGGKVSLTSKELGQLERVFVAVGGESRKTAQQMELLKKAEAAGTITTAQYRDAVTALHASKSKLRTEEQVSVNLSQTANAIRQQLMTAEQLYARRLEETKRQLVELVSTGQLSRKEAAAALRQMKEQDPAIKINNELNTRANQIRLAQLTSEQKFAQSLAKTKSEMDQLVRAGKLSRAEAVAYIQSIQQQSSAHAKLREEEKVSASLSQQASGIRQQLMTAEQLYAQRLDETKRNLVQLVSTGKLSRQEAAAALRQLKEQDPAIERNNSLQARAAQIRQGNLTAEQRYAQALAKTKSEMNELVSAGALTRKEADEHIKSMEKQNPALNKHSSFLRSAGASVVAFAGAYVGVGAAIQKVNEYWAEQTRLINEARDAQLGLAGNQQEASKNLTGVDPAMKDKILTEIVPKLSPLYGIDQGKLTEAIGSSYSASGDIDQAIEAVTAAAALNRQNPEGLDKYSAAAIDLQRATGVDDAEQNLAFLLSSGAASRISDPTALAKNLPVAVSNAVATTVGQDSMTASREAAALFNTFGKAATDVQGDSTVTATTQFADELGKFFRNLDSDASVAAAELAQLDKKSQESGLSKKEEARAARLNMVLDPAQLGDAAKELGELKQIESAAKKDESLPGLTRDQNKRMKDLEDVLRESKQISASPEMLKSATEEQRMLTEKAKGATLTDVELRKREELANFVASASRTKDSGSLFGRIEALRADEGLRQQFQQADFGEAKFKQGFRAILDPSSNLFSQAQQAKDVSTFDRDVFEEQAKFIAGGTSQIGLGTFKGKSDAIIESDNQNRIEAGNLSQVRASYEQFIAKSGRESLVGGFTDYVTRSTLPTSAALGGGTAAEEAASAILNLQQRRSVLEEGGVTATEQVTINTLNNGIELFSEQLMRFAEQAAAGNTDVTPESITSALAILEGNQVRSEIVAGDSGSGLSLMGSLLNPAGGAAASLGVAAVSATEQNATELAAIRDSLREMVSELKSISAQQPPDNGNASTKPNTTKSYSAANRRELTARAG